MSSASDIRQYTQRLLQQCSWVASFTVALNAKGLNADRQLLMLLGCELYETLRHFSAAEAAVYAFEKWPQTHR